MTTLYTGTPGIASFDREQQFPGELAPMVPGIGTTISTAALTKERASYARFVPSRSFNATVIAFVTTVAATENDLVEVGIYNSAGEKIVFSASTAGKLNATAGIQTVSIASTLLTSGTIYYAGFCYGATAGTPATAVVSALQNVKTNQIFGTTVPNIAQGIQGSRTTLPTTATVNSESNAVPLLAIRES